MLRVKATLTGGEIRRFALSSEERTFSILEKKLKTLFDFPEEAPLQVSYVDEEGDEVIFSTDEEMTSFQEDQVLRLNVKGKEPVPSTPTFGDAAEQSPAPAPAPSVSQPFPDPSLLPPQRGHIFHQPPPPPSSASSSPPPFFPAPFSSPFERFGRERNARKQRNLKRVVFISLLFSALASLFLVLLMLSATVSQGSFHHPAHFGAMSSPNGPHHHHFHQEHNMHHQHHHNNQHENNHNNQHQHHQHHHNNQHHNNHNNHNNHDNQNNYNNHDHDIFQQLKSAAVVAFFLSVVLAFVLALIATYYLSSAITAFSASFPQDPLLRQQKINELWNNFNHMILNALNPDYRSPPAAASPASPAQPQNQPHPQTQPQTNQPQGSQPQYHPPPYEGIRHRTSIH